MYKNIFTSIQNFAYMSTKHRGKILEKAITDSGVFKSTIAQKLGLSRTTIYNMMDKEDIPLDVFIKIGKIIHYDFSKDIPEIVGDYTVERLEEPRVTYGNPSLEEVKSQVQYWQKKYTDLMEDHQRMLREVLKEKTDKEKK